MNSFNHIFFKVELTSRCLYSTRETFAGDLVRIRSKSHGGKFISNWKENYELKVAAGYSFVTEISVQVIKWVKDLNKRFFFTTS